MAKEKDARVRRFHTLLWNLEVESGPAPRDLPRALKILRTALWFEFVMIQLPVTSAYALGQRIQPGLYRRAPNGFNHNNLWAKYQAGLHPPGPKTRADAEQHVPGSTLMFEHPLVDAMNITKPIRPRALALLRRLHPGVQRAIFDNAALKQGRYQRRRGVDQLCNWLEPHGDLDALAAFVILVREAVETQDTKNYASLAAGMYRTLVQVCRRGMGCFLWRDLIAAIELLILPLTAHDDWRYEIDPQRFVDATAILNRVLLNQEDRGELRPNEFKRAAFRIVRGHYGFDLRVLLGPAPVLTVSPQTASFNARWEVRADAIKYEWACEAWRAGPAGYFPPAALLNALHTAREELREEFPRQPQPSVMADSDAQLLRPA